MQFCTSFDIHLPLFYVPSVLLSAFLGSCYYWDCCRFLNFSLPWRVVPPPHTLSFSYNQIFTTYLAGMQQQMSIQSVSGWDICSLHLKLWCKNYIKIAWSVCMKRRFLVSVTLISTCIRVTISTATVVLIWITCKNYTSNYRRDNSFL